MNKNKYILGLFTLMLVYPCVASAKWLDDYASLVKQDANKYNIPGYAWVFVDLDQKPTYVTQGVTKKGGSAISQNTVFRLASVSKTFTGALMAKMATQTPLDYQTSVAQIAPGFGFAEHGRSDIQLRHILNQSSGYMPNAYDNLIEANYKPKRVLTMLAKLAPLCKPGKCYTYQNALFGVIDDYFQQQGSSYQAALNKHLLKPLKMTNASVGIDRLKGSKQWARPHVAIARDKYALSRVDSSYYNFSPAAGINASIKDMQIWLQAMLGQHPKVLSKAVIADMTQPYTKTKRELKRRNWRQYLDDAHYGLGWRVYQFEGHKLVYHGGWVKGYRADIAFAPEFGVGFAMLMNAESNRINRYSAEFWAAFFNHVKTQASTAQLQ